MDKKKKIIITLIIIILIILGILIFKKTNTNRQYNNALASIVKASQEYASDNIETVKQQLETKITLEELQNKNYISKDIKNPLTGNTFDKNITVIITKKENIEDLDNVKESYDYALEIIN